MSHSKQKPADPKTTFTGFPPTGSTLCPQCDFDLKGLEPEAACPRCAFEYGHDTRVWTNQHRFRASAWYDIRMLTIVVFATACGILIINWTGPLWRPGFEPMATKIQTLSFVSVALLVGFAILMCTIPRKYLAKHQFVAIVKDGILFKKSIVEDRIFIPWSSIVGVHIDKSYDAVMIERDKGRAVGLSCHLPDLLAIDDFIDDLKRHLSDDIRVNASPLNHVRQNTPKNRMPPIEDLAKGHGSPKRPDHFFHSKLERCPICDYTLFPTSQIQRCPECGLAYDDLCMSWKPNNSTHISAINVFILLGFIVGLVGSMIAFTVNAPASISAIPVLVTTAAGIAMILRIGPGRIALLTDGITIYMNAKSQRTIEYADLRLVRVFTEHRFYRVDVWYRHQNTNRKISIAQQRPDIGLVIINNLQKRCSDLRIELRS